MARYLTIGNPVAEGPPATGRLNPAPSSVRGTRVGFRVQWDSFDVFMHEMETILRDAYGVADVSWWNLMGSIQEEARGRAANPAAFARKADEFAEVSDWAILGLAA
jgi:hypothetical protein